jgi:hypothetical protein
MKHRTLLICLGVFLLHAVTYAQTDTLRISDSYTTHLIFSSDIVYADLSSPADVAAKIIEQNRNLLAVKARGAFGNSTSISALESNGTMHTFIVGYDPYPQQLVIDMRTGGTAGMESAHREVGLGSRADAPELSEMTTTRQKIYHIGARKYGITLLCEEIVSYSDITFVLLSVRNRSSVSYSVADATFVMESRKKGKRAVSFEKGIQPKNRHGSLSAAPGETVRIAYSFDKLTLASDQVIKVYLYEEGGQRNLEITLSAKDINHAASR